MNKKDVNIIETYQCPGCVCGGDISCYEKSDDLACGKHGAGTRGAHIGRIFLGMPKGFDRLGIYEGMKINIFQKFEDGWGYNLFNVPVWKYLDKHGNTIVRGISPRINCPFLHIFLENCIDKIKCLEITKDDIDSMD